MPEGIEVGGGGGGGTIAGIPQKYAIIGAGALLVGGFLLWQKSSGGGGSSSGDPNSTYGAALGPNAALALGDLQTRLMQESGRLQEQISAGFSGVGGGLAGLSSQLDAAASALGDQGTLQQTQLFNYLNSLAGGQADYVTRLYMLLGGHIDSAGRFVAGLPPATATSSTSTSPANGSTSTT